MRNTESHNSSFRLIFGLILIGLGSLLLLDRLHYLDWDELAPYFLPTVLILFGLARLFIPSESSGPFLGVLLLIAGGWLLLYQLGYIHVEPWDFWPLFLVLLGGWIAWQAVSGRRERREVGGPVERAGRSGSDEVNAAAILGSAKRISNSTDFRGGDLFALMGGCEIDLSRAKITHGPAVIDAFAMWGGIEIRVPDDWTVKVRGVALLGAYEDNTHPPREESDQELVIKGFVTMGGVEIKN